MIWEFLLKLNDQRTYIISLEDGGPRFHVYSQKVADHIFNKLQKTFATKVKLSIVNHCDLVTQESDIEKCQVMMT